MAHERTQTESEDLSPTPGSGGDRPRFGTRIAALLLDYLLILGWIGVVIAGVLAFVGITGSLPDFRAGGAVSAEIYGFLLLVVPVGVYLYACEASAAQATLGKRALRLRVMDASNRSRPTRPQTLVRTVVKLAPWELAHFFVWQVVAAGDDTPPWIDIGLVAAVLVPVLYVAMVAFQQDARGPHDLAAGTIVRRGPFQLYPPAPVNPPPHSEYP